MSDHKKKELLSAAVLVILGLTAFSWFEGTHSAVAGYDFATSLNPLDELKRSVYLWDERLYAGAPNVLGIGTMPFFLLQYALKYATGSLYRGEMVFFFILFTLPGLSMYLFLLTMCRGDGKRTTAFFGALFYMFNTFVVVKWNRGELITLFSYGTLPFYLALVERGLRSPLTVRFLLLFICAVFFFPVTLGHSADFLIVTGIITAFTLWRAASLFNGALLKRALFLLGATVLASAWWALPLFASLKGGGAGITSFTTNELEMVNYYSKWATLLNIMKLWFSPMYDTSVEFGTQFYRPGSLFFPLIGFSALLFRRNSTVLFFSALAVAGLWLSKGTSPPVPWVYEWMYRHIPYFFVFRAPSRYFPLVYTVSLAVLIGHTAGFATVGVKKIFTKKKSIRFVPGAAVAALILFSSWPLFSGSTLFRTARGDNLYPGVFIDIPGYYGKLDSWFKSREGYFRVHSFVTDSYLNYDWGYSSTDIMPKVIEAPQTLKFSQELVFGSNGFHDLMDTTDRDFWNWDYGRTAKTLSLLSVGYITVVDDVMRRYLPDSNYYEVLGADLENEPGISVAARIGKATVYENSYRLPHIFAVPKTKFVFGGPSSLTDLSLTDHLDRPALLFIDRLDEHSLAAPADSAGGLIIDGNTARDIACENLSVIDSSPYGGSGFYADEDDEYLIWGRPAKGNTGTPVVSVDGKPVTGAEKPGTRWINIGSARLKKGGHDLSIDEGGFEKVLAVSAKSWRDELEKTKRLLSRPPLPTEVLVRLKSGERYSFYSSGDITVKAVNTRGVVKKNIPGLTEDYSTDPDLLNWVSNGTTPVSTSYGVTLKADRETLSAGRRFGKGLDIEQFPYVRVEGASTPKGYFDLDLAIGVDTDNDGWADAVIKTPLVRKGREAAHEKLSETLKKRFGYPGRPQYRALWVVFELKKTRGAPEVKGASYTVKSLEFYYSVPEFKSNTGPQRIRVDGSPLSDTLKPGAGQHEIRSWEGSETVLIRLYSKEAAVDDGVLPSLEWKKIDSTRYRVRVRGARRPFWLVFNESYNTGWKASVPETGETGVRDASIVALPGLTGRGREITDHRMVNGYANGWWVTEAGDFDIDLDFRPQSMLDSGVFVSASALTVFLITSPLYLLKGRVYTGFLRRGKSRRSRRKRGTGGAARE